MATASTKVLFIVGFARSGTTVIGNLLGEYDGISHAGEVRMLWKRDLAQAGPPCGCGEPVASCDWWAAVLEDWARQPSEAVGASRAGLERDATLAEVGRAMTRLQKAAEAGHGWWRGRRAPKGDHQKLISGYATAQAQLYGAIARTADSRVIVDSSKRPVHAEIMHQAVDLDPYLVHLVRDPRGVVYSRQQKGEGSRSSRSQVGWDAVKWLHRNLLSERVRRLYGDDRSMFLRYEDFTRDPKAAVESIITMLGEPLDGSPFLDSAAAVLGPNHVSGGNRNRFARGRVEVSQDLRWTKGLSRFDRATVNLLAGPGIIRYGYTKAPSGSRVFSPPPQRQV